MGSINKILNGLLVSAGKAEYLLRKRKTSPVIMFYHGVSLNMTRPDDKHIHYQLFKDQLSTLKKYFQFVRVEDIPDMLDNGDNTPTLAVTFDDGYKNNISLAADILKDLDIPATFFLSTGYIGGNRWMWTDLLEHAVYKTEKDGLVVDETGLVLRLKNEEEKEQALVEVKRELKKIDFYKVGSIVQHIADSLLDGNVEAPYGDYEFMDWNDVKMLNDSGFSIGAHTVNHPILSRVETRQAETEIIDSKHTIIDKIGSCSDIFCYPNGKKSDYNQDVINICKKHFRAALTTNYGCASGDNLFELKRVGISNLLQGSVLVRRLVNQALDN